MRKAEPILTHVELQHTQINTNYRSGLAGDSIAKSNEVVEGSAAEGSLVLIRKN